MCADVCVRVFVSLSHVGRSLAQKKRRAANASQQRRCWPILRPCWAVQDLRLFCPRATPKTAHEDAEDLGQYLESTHGVVNKEAKSVMQDTTGNCIRRL